jgi:hypothetical protein
MSVEGGALRRLNERFGDHAHRRLAELAPPLAADNRTVPALAEIAPIFPTPETESPLKQF